MRFPDVDLGTIDALDFNLPDVPLRLFAGNLADAAFVKVWLDVQMRLNGQSNDRGKVSVCMAIVIT